jgi:hypothetical protein
MGIEYRYEPEKFQGEGFRYIPDFYLPESNRFVEIKPCEPTEEDLDKMDALPPSAASLLIVGEPGKEKVSEDGGAYGCFTQCPFCGTLKIFELREDGEFRPYPQNLFCSCIQLSHFAEKYDIDSAFMDFCSYAGGPPQEVEWVRGTPMLDLSYEISNSMRFEEPGYEREMEGWKTCIRRLSKRGVFSYPIITEQIARFAQSFKLDPKCPRFRSYPTKLRSKP